jgi:hypothetical protein
MVDDDEVHPRLSNGGRTHSDMDEAFCARMRAAIEAGLESAAIGVVTMKNPNRSQQSPSRYPSRNARWGMLK